MRGIAAMALLVLTACGPSTQSTLVETALAPADAYTCVMRELAKMKYQVKAADRDAGFIQAERKTSGAGTALFTGASYYLEMAVTIVPGAAGKPTQLNVSQTGSKQEGGGSRTSTGMVLTKGDKKEATAIITACSAG